MAGSILSLDKAFENPMYGSSSTSTTPTASNILLATVVVYLSSISSGQKALTFGQFSGSPLITFCLQTEQKVEPMHENPMYEIAEKEDLDKIESLDSEM